MTEEDILNLDQNDPSINAFLFAYICEKKDQPSLIIKMVKEKGLNVNLEVGGGISLFELSCSKFDLEMVKFFVEHGADLSLRDGRVALGQACSASKLDTAQYLIDKGIKIT